MQCGTQYALSAAAPSACAICEDERQYVGREGQHWTTRQQLAQSHSVRIDEDDGMLGIALSPAFAIDQRALLVPGKAGNILWECVSLVNDDAVAALQARGGVAAIAISHPHFYASMVDWSIALGGVPIYVHADDREWVQRTSPLFRFWNEDRLALSSDVTLIRCGGHFPGSTMLHWRHGVRGGGALFPGDAAQVALSRRHVSFMYSYPNLIPLAPHAVRRIARALVDLDYDDVYGFSWGRNIIGGGKVAILRSVSRYLAALNSHSTKLERHACATL